MRFLVQNSASASSSLSSPQVFRTEFLVQARLIRGLADRSLILRDGFLVAVGFCVSLSQDLMNVPGIRVCLYILS
jgi:hypothetical protein